MLTYYKLYIFLEETTAAVAHKTHTLSSREKKVKKGRLVDFLVLLGWCRLSSFRDSSGHFHCYVRSFLYSFVHTNLFSKLNVYERHKMDERRRRSRNFLAKKAGRDVLAE